MPVITSDEMIRQVNERLAAGYELWKGYGLPELTVQDLDVVPAHVATVYKDGAFALDYASACQCFYLFRKLHTMVEAYSEQATLLGDYFFSQFSHYLIPIDSTELIAVFSEFLKEDVVRNRQEENTFSIERYLDFIKQGAKEI